MSSHDVYGRVTTSAAVLDATRKLSAQAVLFTNAVAERLGLAPTDVECVEVLAASGRMSAGELATAIGLTSGATTRMLDRLEQAGYVRRLPDPADRRRVLVEPVLEKVTAVTEHFDALTRANEAALAGDDAQLDAIRAYLETSLRVARAETARIRDGAGTTESRGASFMAPLAGATRGRLVFLSGAPDVRLHADPSLTGLCRADFDGPAPRVRVRDGIVTVHYGRFSWLDWRARLGDSRIEISAHRRRARGTIDLNATIPWDIEVRGGAANVGGELDGLDLGSLVITGGVSRVEMRLPTPRRLVPIRVGGGASDLTFRRPAGTAARIRVRGGASRVTLDGKRINGVGSVELASSGAGGDGPGYLIDIDGGASRITVETT